MDDLAELTVMEQSRNTLVNPIGEAIAIAVEKFKHWRQVEMPVTHRFAPGIYLREIFMPAGTFVIGHVHRTRHFNIVLRGRALVQMEGRTVEIAAPSTFESSPGVQKCLYIVEDMAWQTVHANPDDLRDVVKLEEMIFQFDTEWAQAKGEMTLDEFRMHLGRQNPQP